MNPKFFILESGYIINVATIKYVEKYKDECYFKTGGDHDYVRATLKDYQKFVETMCQA